MRVHIEQHGEEEEESDTDTLVDLDSRVGTPYVGSTMGRGTISSGTQLYGRTGRGRTTPLYGSRLQLEHASDNGSERSHRYFTKRPNIDAYDKKAPMAMSVTILSIKTIPR